MRVIAEGVETTEQVAKLRELGCEFAQGFHFSVPINAQEATDLLAEEYHWSDSSKTGHIDRWAVSGNELPRAASSG